MKVSRSQSTVLLALLLFALIALGALSRLHISVLGDAGVQLEHYLDAPLLMLGGQPITVYFLLKVSFFLVLLILFSSFTMRVLQKRVLIHTPLALGQQYAVARVASYLVFLLGLIIGLQSIGLNLNSLVVVGGALGIGVGLGLQAVVGNFVAGLILLVEQPIKLGDRIEVGDTYGDVVKMSGRSTWVQTNENVVIIVPNSDFINEKVTNWTANDRQVRVSLRVGVSYDSDPHQVRELLLRVAAQHADVLADPAPEVIFLDFGDSSLDFELRVWTVRHVQTPTRLKSDLFFAIFEAFKAASIEIPFPQRDLHLRSVSEGALAALESQRP